MFQAFYNTYNVKIEEGGLDLFYFSFHFSIFFSILFLYFLFLEQLELELISYAITSVTWWQKTDYETWEKLVEDSRTNDVIQHGHHMVV